MAIVAKHVASVLDNPEYRFGESIVSGARKATYISRMGAQIVLEWNDSRTIDRIPMGMVRSTGVLDEDFIERFVSTATEHKAKGGVRKGPRRLIHNPAEKTLRRQFVRAKILKKGMVPKSASDEPMHRTKVSEGNA